ncbi:hypothetical protein BC830DRAFT_1094497 [Chytriomyces sp. MP71]|nr:hypothetical protein BC830DRAFT_1094497 [Chytriomyces sp. MP71]
MQANRKRDFCFLLFLPTELNGEKRFEGDHAHYLRRKMDEVSIALGVAALALLLKYRSDSFRSESTDTHPALLRNQVVTGNTRNAGEWAIVRNRATPYNNNNIPQFVKSVTDSLAAALDAPARTAQPLLHSRPTAEAPFVATRVGQVATDVKDLGSGLHTLLGTAKNTLVGNFVESVDAVKVELACILHGFVSCWWDSGDKEVALDEATLKKILLQTEMRAIVVLETTVDSVLSVAGQCKKLEHVIVAGVSSLSKEFSERAAALKVNIHTLDAIKARGKANPHEQVKRELSDIYSIVYGADEKDLKGTEITFLNASAAISAIYITLPQSVKMTNSDSYLSVCHVSSPFERCIIFAVLIAGGQVAFSSGKAVMKDIQAFSPTLIHTNSKTLDTFANAIDSHSSSKSWGVRKAISVKMQEVEEGRCWKGTLYDKLFLGEIQNGIFGGHLRYIWNSPDLRKDDTQTVKKIRAVVGSQVIQTLSAAETVGLAFYTWFGDYTEVDHVGVPAANLEYKLVDAPSKHYLVTDNPNPKGEIWFRGPGVAKAYHKDSVKMANQVDEEGWFKSGIYAQLFPNGTLGVLA